MGDVFRSGYVSLMGRPNVGKSTLLNVLLGQKIAIVTEKAQTTRNRIVGIKTLDRAQIIFIDTPGIHRPRNLLGRTMVRTVKEVLKEIDVAVLVTEADVRVPADREIIESFRNIDRPVILLINKTDKVHYPDLLPLIDDYRNQFAFSEIIPVSAIKEEGVDIFVSSIVRHLPEGPKYYPDELVTDQFERFMVAEIIREKVMSRTTDEIPYSVAVEVIAWNEREDGVIFIDANIYVERKGQKGIIIGEKGNRLKTIGTLARKEMEQLLGTKVFLQVWVKVRKGWRDDKRILDELGYR
jgi:GTP-binding protein Era